MDGAVCAVDSEQGLVANPFRCLLGVDYTGEAVFAGQDCGVAELAALIGDDGGDFGNVGEKFGSGHGGDDDTGK